MILDDSFFMPENDPEFERFPLKEIERMPVDLSVPEGVEKDDPIHWYMDEIGQISCLTQEQEEVLLAQMEEGNERAKKQLLESYLPVVAGIAKEFIGLGMAFSDLVQEGNIGLMAAVEEYGANMGYSFYSYAVWMIRREIRSGLEENGEISHISNYMADTMNKLMDLSKEFTEKYGRSPEPEELAEAVDMPLERVQEILNIAQEASEEEKEEKENVEAPIENDTSKIVDEAARIAILKERVEGLLAQVSEQEQKILRLHYGLEDGKAKTLQEVGELLHMSLEEVSSIETRALATLNQAKEIE